MSSKIISSLSSSLFVSIGTALRLPEGGDVGNCFIRSSLLCLGTKISSSRTSRQFSATLIISIALANLMMFKKIFSEDDVVLLRLVEVILISFLHH